MINLVRGLEPEIIPFEIIYDKRTKRGSLLTKVGTKEIKYCSDGAKKLHEAFPISMVDPRHSWKIMAQYVEEVKNQGNFELFVEGKSFFEYDYLELSSIEPEGILRNAEEHSFQDVLKKSVYTIVYAEKNKEKEVIQITISYNTEVKTGMIEVTGEKTTQRQILEHYEFKDAFPMVMIEHKHEWKIKARLPETNDVNKRNHFELFINEKSFQ